MIDEMLIVFVVLTTLCTILIIGLGFMRRPTRHAAIFSSAFATAMCAGYLWLASAALDQNWLSAIGTGVTLGASALLWVGLRARRKARRIYLVPTELTFVGVIVLLTASATTSWAELALRGAVALTAAFAAGTIYELVRLGPLYRDEALPLGLMSFFFIVVAMVAAIDAVLRFVRGASLDAVSLLALRNAAVLGAAVYFVAALATLLLLVRETKASRSGGLRIDFDTIARDRLARAAERSDLWWSLLEVRLDDPVAMREASNTAAFDHAAARFAADLRAVLPAEADLGRTSRTTYQVLLPRAEASVRPLMSALLERVSTRDPAQRIDARVSASIGWAPVSIIGFALQDLKSAAADAADTAQRSGGDRWERADVAALYAEEALTPPGMPVIAGTSAGPRPA